MNRKSQKTLLICSGIFLLILVVVYLEIFVGFKSNKVKEDLFYPVIISFFLIGFISLINLYQDLSKRPFSLYAIFWIFNFFFFFLSPLSSYLLDRFPLTQGTFGIHYSASSIILIANSAIILWSTIFMISYFTFHKEKSFLFKLLHKPLLKQIKNENIKIAIVLSIFIGVILVVSFGLKSFTTRGLFDEITKQKVQSRPMLLIARQFLRTIPAITVGSLFLVSLRKIFKRKLLWYLLVSILCIITLILSNPLGAARSWVAAVYLGYFAILIFKKWVNGAVFLLTMLIGLLVVFSAINIGRRLYIEKSWGEQSLKFDPMGPKELMTSGGFDAYENFCHTIELSKIKGITHGKQLLGSMLFFIPRSIWSSKPVGSGAEVGNYLVQNYNLNYSNVSCPLIAEGYINFGFFGIILFAIVFGKIISLLDFLYYKIAKEKDYLALFKLLYPFLLGFFFFMLRGDLMSSFAYVIAFAFSFIVFFVKVPECLMVRS